MYVQKPLKELQKDYTDALALFAAGDGETGRSELFRGYNRLLFAGKQEDRILKLIFSTLAEALDRAPGDEVSRVLHLYLFQDFLESHAEKSAVQEILCRYLDHYSFRKPALQTALRLRRKR